MVTEKGHKEWRKIRVILLERKDGRKTFLSVMDKKPDRIIKKAFKKKA